MGLLDRLLAHNQPTTGGRYPGYEIPDHPSRQRRARHHTHGARRAAALGQAWQDADEAREKRR